MATKKSMFRGREIELVNNQWLFSDTGEPTVETWEDRPCGHCGLYNTPEGHDGCLGTLPNVMNACCGHGDTLQAYVQFSNGNVAQSNVAIEMIGYLKNERKKDE